MKRIDQSCRLFYRSGSFHNRRRGAPEVYCCAPKIKNTDADNTLAQFNLLIEQILDGGAGRSKYQRWEIDLLLDIESCHLDGATVATVLRQYQRAVRDEMKNGAIFPLTLSQYLKT